MHERGRRGEQTEVIDGSGRIKHEKNQRENLHRLLLHVRGRPRRGGGALTAAKHANEFPAFAMLLGDGEAAGKGK